MDLMEFQDRYQKFAKAHFLQIYFPPHLHLIELNHACHVLIIIVVLSLLMDM